MAFCQATKIPISRLKPFLAREWVLCASIAGLIITSLFLKKFPLYETRDFKIIFLLLIQFVLIKGLEQTGLFALLAYWLGKQRNLHLKILLIAFLLAPLITNDLALIVLCPLTLELNLARPELFFSLMAVLVNAASALTPTGNPQNLFIYWFYGVNLPSFLKAMIPFSLPLGLIAFLIAYFSFPKGNFSPPKTQKPLIDKTKLYYHLALFITGLLLIFRLIPLKIGFLLLVLSILADFKNLKVDYLLLLTFLAFFGFTDNLRYLLRTKLAHPHHVFWSSLLLSQFISNVPTALLLSDFTSKWQALLWGVNTGGFGNLIGSLANLIVYRAYLSRYRANVKFLCWFHLIGYLFLALGIFLFFYLPC